MQSTVKLTLQSPIPVRCAVWQLRWFRLWVSPHEGWKRRRRCCPVSWDTVPRELCKVWISKQACPSALPLRSRLKRWNVPWDSSRLWPCLLLFFSAGSIRNSRRWWYHRWLWAHSLSWTCDGPAWVQNYLFDCLFAGDVLDLEVQQPAEEAIVLTLHLLHQSNI